MLLQIQLIQPKVQPTELKDGESIDSIYFDEAQIEIISDGISKKEVHGEKKGIVIPIQQSKLGLIRRCRLIQSTNFKCLP
jgi:hypothetical protein